MLKVEIVPAFKDNYIWLIHKENDRKIAIVDPGDADPVLAAIERDGWQPVAILITHHHADHIGGLQTLKQHYDIPVYGPQRENIRGLTESLQGNEQIHLDALDTTFQVLDVPGHTRGHIAYYTDGMLFCGDTLFTAGCGRLFEGSPEQMYDSLQKIAALPDDTQIYCAHEYTLDNLDFARVVEPDSAPLLKRIEDSEAARRRQQPTVPASLALEKQTNPFLRCHLEHIRQAAETFALKSLTPGVDTFSVVRHWKDTLD